MLDPTDWQAFRAQAHRALDDAFDFLQTVRERPVWQAVPDEVKSRLQETLPQDESDFDAVYREFSELILPYATGNIHPRFFGWVHGSGTPAGALAELLAATMNSNVGGRDHGAVYVERQIVRWFTALYGWPETATGILVTGTSAANLIAVLVARTKALGTAVREDGLRSSNLVGYASSATHGCVRKAFEAAGLGAAALRVLPVDPEHRCRPASLVEAIARDRAAGYKPFLVVGNAGTVDTGAIDPLNELADLAEGESLWFHVDGAFGATAYLSESLRPRLAGIERADSIAFDFHKWLHVPYDAGCVLIRDGDMHRATFATEGPYITRMPRGLAAGTPWFADFGPDLSRGFRALKVWFTLKHFGARKLAAAMERNCEQARYLATLVDADARFEMLAPVNLNIVCFRYRSNRLNDDALDGFNDELVVRLQESGAAVASSTTIFGRRAIRVNITNHRSQDSDFDLLIAKLASIGDRLLDETF
ncbi:MAG TPA: pyridoxal-dependent decarboxylase [Candidatus Baltobacteraceae bacterium]|jgi:glutamate/tyrosine decarboxylase-like PLP-dependent enzyme